MNIGDLENVLGAALLMMKQAERLIMDGFEPISFPQIPEDAKLAEVIVRLDIASCSLNTASMKVRSAKSKLMELRANLEKT